MNLKTFQKSFQNREINIKPYVIVVSIFISILLTVVFLNNNLEDYYIVNGKVIDNKIVIIINNEELDKITKNKELKIERNIFTYKIDRISNFDNLDYLYDEVVLDIDDIPKEYLIENNYIKLKIIVNRTTIFDYLIKTLKGEWLYERNKQRRTTRNKWRI